MKQRKFIEFRPGVFVERGETVRGSDGHAWVMGRNGVWLSTHGTQPPAELRNPPTEGRDRYHADQEFRGAKHGWEW